MEEQKAKNTLQKLYFWIEDGDVGLNTSFEEVKDALWHVITKKF